MIIFPEHILKGCESVLCLFAAAFGGEHDVEFIYKAGIKDCRVVDHDPEAMKKLYHFGFKQTIGDAFDFITLACEIGWKYDVVICDQWTGQDIQVWGYYNKLKSITKKYLVLSVCQESLDEGLKLPDGELIRRSDFRGGIFCHITKI